MNNKLKISLVLGVLITLIVILIASLFLLSGPRDTLEGFSQEQKDEISLARQEWDQNGNPDHISSFFSKVNDYKMLMPLCEEEVLSDSITCYRLLAIEKGEDKEKICEAIPQKICRGDETCIANLPEIRADCKLQLPFIR